MLMQLPRLMVAAPHSGCGKTTVVSGLLAAFLQAGDHPAAFKCGPDFIDPLFHGSVLGTPCRNLDLYLSDTPTVQGLFGAAAQGRDLSIIEGVMGYYDGIGTGSEAGGYALARTTQTPVLLVVPAGGASLSLAALVQGFLRFREPSGIVGLLLNRCGRTQYERLKPMLEQELGIPVVGFLPPDERYRLESRHLGLVTAAETAHLKQKMKLLGTCLRETVDLEMVRRLARSAPPLEVPMLESAGASVRAGGKPGPVIAVARDLAFCFYYKENLELLEQLGARLRYFSPIAGEPLPPETAGVYLGGGYPELHAPALSAARETAAELRAAFRHGMPFIAECGGFLYLQEYYESTQGRLPMVGALPGGWRMGNRLARPFGYLELTARADLGLCHAGDRLRAHVFHYSISDVPGRAFDATKPTTSEAVRCGHLGSHFYAGYPHLYFYGVQGFVREFVALADRFFNDFLQKV